MLRHITRLALAGALTCLMGLLLLISAPPASAHEADTCDAECQARFDGGTGGQYNPAGFYRNEPHFFSANNRLEPNQRGDQGYRWAVAGPKDFDQRSVFQGQGAEAEYGPTPRDNTAQQGLMMADLVEACQRGNHAAYCPIDFDYSDTSTHWGLNEISNSYFANALSYQFNRWGSWNQANWRWTIYLQNGSGGLDWGLNTWGGAGQPRDNFGSVATVRELRQFLMSEINSGVGSENYRYNLARAIVYLEYIYADDLDHPIEMLSIPQNWYFVCLTPRLNPDGSVYLYDNRPIMELYRPITFADPFAYDPVERAMSCPPHTDGRWEYAYESEIRGWSEDIVIEINAPYALWTEVRDDSPGGVGKRTFTDQSEYRLTPLGEKLTEICETRGGTCSEDVVFTDEELAELEEAASRSHNTTGPKVDLTPENRRALAEGRLALIGEWAQDAVITKHERRDRWMRRWTETRTYYDDNGNIVDRITHTSPWEYANEPDRDINVGEATFHYGQRHFTGGYQALVTHCNQTGFDSAVGHRSIDERATGDQSFTGTYLAGSAVSRTFTDPADKPWGVTGPTAQLGFYDKICSYQGTRTDVGTGDATSEQPASSITQFRQNAWDDLPLAYYTPTSDGWVSYRGDGPDGFTATRWEGGTPEPGLFWLGGQDCESGAMSEGFFGTDEREAPVLRQWVHQDFSSSTVAIGVGCYDRIVTRGAWASAARKPQVLTMKWDFSPEVATVIPADNIGLDRDGHATYDKATVGAEVRGQVLSSHEVGRTVVEAQQEVWEAATGSGSTNTLDTPVPYGTDLDAAGAWTTSPDRFSPYYYALKFVRAVGQ